jgi:hypothetical protein
MFIRSAVVSRIIVELPAIHPVKSCDVLDGVIIERGAVGPQIDSFIGVRGLHSEENPGISAHARFHGDVAFNHTVLEINTRKEGRPDQGFPSIETKVTGRAGASQTKRDAGFAAASFSASPLIHCMLKVCSHSILGFP